MNRFPDLDAAKEPSTRLHPRGPTTPEELGDVLARLVWESFSDFVVAPSTRTLLKEFGAPVADGVPDERRAEELLILHMWAHTRAVQLAFFGRAPEGQVRKTLDAMHRAVFEDMVANGTPRHQLPVFEQRVSARYAEYYEAASVSDEQVGKIALRCLVDEPGGGPPDGFRLLTERAVEVANPLRDYLDELELED